MKKHILFVIQMTLVFLLAIQTLLAQTTPVIGLHENPARIFALTNATIIPKAGEKVDEGTLIIRDGLIEAVGQDVSIPKDATILDVKGRTIYPGFIDLYTHYGIPEKESTNSDSKGTNKSQSQATYWNPAVLPDR